VAFGNKNFEVANEFVHLEALVTPKDDVEIQRITQTANRYFCGLRSSQYLGTSDKVNDLQNRDPPGPAVRQ
jgi:hypothetical protein